MPRPREYESNAERQRAYRERQQEELAAERRAEAQQLAAVESTARELERRRVYIEEAVTRARLDAESRARSRETARALNKDLGPVDVEARVERARAYAAWRWDAHLAGEVASL